MKKSFIIIVLFLIFIQFTVSEQIDNIILLDTSESMFPYFSGTIDILLEEIVKEQLESGDTFHLLSFNDYPEYEISRTIRNEMEIKDIFNRILLLQPIGKYTDLISAFSFLYEYTNKLQLNSIKRIIILTDGIHDPPPESLYPISRDNKSDIVKISENMKRQGWKVSLIQFPIINTNSDNLDSDDTENHASSLLSENNSLSENNLFPLIADTLDETVIVIDKEVRENSTSHDITGAPEIIYPGDVGTVGRKFEAVFRIINHSTDSVLLKLMSINSYNGLLYNEPVSIQLDPKETKSIELILKIPDNIEKGEYNNTIELFFNDSYRAYPRTGNIIYYFDPENSNIRKSLNTRIILYIFLGLVFLAAIIYIIVNIIRSLKISSTHYKQKNKTVNPKNNTSGSTGTRQKFRNIEKENKTGQIAIEMIVKNQNRQIGHRNIHFIEELHPLSVGGAGSEYFLIFIIDTGKRIGEIVLEKGIVSFIPNDNDSFPDLAGQKLYNCLNRSIKVVNKRGVETSIVFRNWISPVERLNKIMHLADRSGLPDFKY